MQFLKYKKKKKNQCAQRLEVLSDLRGTYEPVDDRILSIADKLVKYFKEHFHKMVETPFLRALSTIAFVPAYGNFLGFFFT